MIQKKRYKYVLQKKDYDCGVAATTAMLLNAKVKGISYRKLKKELKLNRNGVASDRLTSYFSNFVDLKPKVKVRARIEDLRSETQKGRLALVMYQTWGKPHELRDLKCGHYSVCVRVYRNKVYLLDPSAHKDWGDGVGWRTIDVLEFKKLWKDKEFGKVIRGWMMTVTPFKRKKALKFDN
jgi:predicted double-glycine peptidase